MTHSGQSTDALHSAAAGVVAAARTRVTGPGPLHHAPALAARRSEVESLQAGRHHRWRVRESRCRRARAAVAGRALWAVARAWVIHILGAGAGRVGGAHRLDGVLRRLAGTHRRREDSQVLLGIHIQEARGQPAHDVVGHRLRERDLRVAGNALGLEAHVAELPYKRLERHAVLQRDRDGRREGVHHAAQRRALLADVGEEDLADAAVLVHAGGDVTLVAADRELVRDRL